MTASNLSPADAFAQVEASMIAGQDHFRAALAAPTADDRIFAYRSTGLSIAYPGNGEGGVHTAGPAYGATVEDLRAAFGRDVFFQNGHKERAVEMTRREAIEIALADNVAALDDLRAKMADREAA